MGDACGPWVLRKSPPVAWPWGGAFVSPAHSRPGAVLLRSGPGGRAKPVPAGPTDPLVTESGAVYVLVSRRLLGRSAGLSDPCPG